MSLVALGERRSRQSESGKTHASLERDVTRSQLRHLHENPCLARADVVARRSGIQTRRTRQYSREECCLRPREPRGRLTEVDLRRSLDAVDATPQELDNFYSKNYEDYLGL